VASADDPVDATRALAAAVGAGVRRSA